MQFTCYKQFFFKQFSLAEVRSLVLFDPMKKVYEVIPLWSKVDLVAMAIKEYSALLEPHHQII